MYEAEKSWERAEAETRLFLERHPDFSTYQ